jgi:hypothetical protein
VLSRRFQVVGYPYRSRAHDLNFREIAPGFFRNFFRDLASDDYSWSRPNKRFLPYDIYLPSLRSPSLGEIVVEMSNRNCSAKWRISAK